MTALEINTEFRPLSFGLIVHYFLPTQYMLSHRQYQIFYEKLIIIFGDI